MDDLLQSEHSVGENSREGARRPGRMALCLLATAIAALSIAVATALASTGALTPQGCIADVGDLAGCGTTQQGLAAAFGVATSPDGKSVYVASEIDDAVVRFDRNITTGALTPQGCIADVGDAAGCGTTQQGLDGAIGVAVSPDGKSVYAASFLDNAVVRFDRNTTTGALTPAGCIADVGDAAGCGTTQQGLGEAVGVAVTPDGKSVYVASQADDAIVRFDRNITTGALTPQGCIADVGDAAGCGTTQQGLDGAGGVAVSADGKSVYVASNLDSAVVRFDRNTTSGALTGQGCIADVGDTAGCGTTQQGLDGATGVAVSPDGKSAYVASQNDFAIVRFDRNTTTGALSGQGCIADVGDAAGCGATQQGLDGASGVAASPDAKSVYVASNGDSAIVRFDRNTTPGALTGQGCIADVGDLAGCGATQQGLDSAKGVAVSADAKSAYVASSGDSAIVRFNREDPPETQIDSGPSGITNDPTPTFTFSSDEVNVTFGCSVDGAAFGACSGPASHTTGVLADGAHTFEVRAADAFGTADSSPASRAFTVDTIAPAAPAIAGSSPASPANDNNPELVGSAEAGSTVNLYTSADCTGSPAATDTAANFASPVITVAVANDSTTTFKATATDAVGNTSPCSAGLTYVEDSTAPETTVDSGPSDGSRTNDATPAFGFTSSEAGSSFQCKVDSSAYAACSSPNTIAALADGSHSFEVRATDQAGNADPTPASRSFTVDTRAPNTKLTGGPPPLTTKHTATFKFKSTERGSSFKCKLDRQRYKPCRSPKTYKHLKRGKHAFKVRATDRAGNLDPTPANRGWRIR